METVVRRVRQVDAVVVVAVEVDEPTLLMIAYAEAESGERCAAVAHTLIVDIVVVVTCLGGAVQCGICRLHVAELRVVRNLGLADCTDELNVKEACELELSAELCTVVRLVHIGHRYIDERVAVVVIEVLPVGYVSHAAVVALHVEVEP